jgi:hypothetical protein
METLPVAELLAKLRSLAESEGLHADSLLNKLTAEREIPLGKWFLGGRKVVYRMSCAVDEVEHGVRFRESTTETSWGVPPPTLRTETTSQSASHVWHAATVTSTGGRAGFNIGQVRDHFEAAVGAAGWRFRLEAGRRP